MADYLWPDALKPRTSEFWPRDNSPGFRSPYTQTEQILDTGVPVWVCSMTFRLHKHKAWALDGFLAKLRGRRNRALIWNHHKSRAEAGSHEDWAGDQAPQPWSDGTWFVDGNGNQTGWLTSGRPTTAVAPALMEATAITVDGLRPNGLYRSGEQFGLTHAGVGRVYMLEDDVIADANGAGKLRFWPPLRGAVAEGDPLVLDRPTAPFRLVSAEAPRNQGDSKHIHSYTLDWVEDLTDLP